MLHFKQGLLGPGENHEPCIAVAEAVAGEGVIDLLVCYGKVLARNPAPDHAYAVTE